MRSEVLVIGGGLAGAAAAIELARSGTTVTLVERERVTQHKVCGEFLSAEALHYLWRLGVSVLDLGARAITAVRLASSGEACEAALPFEAMSLTRRCLDDALLEHAEHCGVKVQRGSTVEQLTRGADSWGITLANGEKLAAAAVFVATGKHDVRGHLRPAGPQQGLVGLKMYWRLHPEQYASLGGSVELVTYPGGYAGLQPVEGGLANLCSLIQARQLRRLGGKWEDLLSHMLAHSAHLRSRLEGAEPGLSKPLSIASLPYGFVRGSSDGLWYLGDQAAVIPSFTGDGMSLALHSGVLAAQQYAQGHTADEYQRKLCSQVKQQVRFATVVSRAVVAGPRAALLAPRIWPGVLPWIARRTRIAPEHMLM